MPNAYERRKSVPIPMSCSAVLPPEEKSEAAGLKQALASSRYFFGACAGVNKTCSMLSAGRRSAPKGIGDVVVGPGRNPRPRRNQEIAGRNAHSAAHREGAVSRHADQGVRPGRGARPRKPQLILLDELAHTNTCTRIATIPSAGRMSRNCSIPASASIPPSTFSIWKASTTSSRASPASGSSKPCLTPCSTAPTKSRWSIFRQEELLKRPQGRPKSISRRKPRSAQRRISSRRVT